MIACLLKTVLWIGSYRQSKILVWFLALNLTLFELVLTLYSFGVFLCQSVFGGKTFFTLRYRGPLLFLALNLLLYDV